MSIGIALYQIKTELNFVYVGWGVTCINCLHPYHL